MNAIELFKRSRWWQQFEEFRPQDITSYCKVTPRTAKDILHKLRPELSERQVNGGVAYARTRRSLNAPLRTRRFDWEQDNWHTPEWRLP